MRFPALPQLAAAFGLVLVLLAPPVLRGAEPHEPYIGVDINLQLQAPDFVTTVRTDGNGMALLKVAAAGQYTLFIQPVPRNRQGNYNPDRYNQATLSIKGAAEAVTGVYNFTGLKPYKVVVKVNHGATLIIKVTPPPQPKDASEVPPAMQ